MFLVMIAIGTTDILFALDSIPAIFGLTQEAYIVLTANAFALFGLRQMYFLLHGLLDKLDLPEHRPGRDPRVHRREADPARAPRDDGRHAGDPVGALARLHRGHADRHGGGVVVGRAPQPRARAHGRYGRRRGARRRAPGWATSSRGSTFAGACPRTNRPRSADHQPRSRHSSRCGRSAPSVVSLPWPGIDPGLVGVLLEELVLDVGRSAASKSTRALMVLPTPPGKSESPVMRCGWPSGSS